MTNLLKEEQWRSHIAACTSSGMSAKAWCKANDIIPHRYHYWKRKFKAAEGKPAPGTRRRFVLPDTRTRGSRWRSGWHQ